MAIGAAGSDVTPARVSQMLSRINKVEASTGRCLADAIDTATNNWLVVGKTKVSRRQEQADDARSAGPAGCHRHHLLHPHGDRSAGLYERWSINPTAMPPRFDSVPAS